MVTIVPILEMGYKSGILGTFYVIYILLEFKHLKTYQTVYLEKSKLEGEPSKDVQ